MVNYSPEAGMRGLKQIWKSLHDREDITPEQANEIFAKHTLHFLNRVYPDWVKEQKE